MRICDVDECGSAHWAKGFCRLHYKRWRATGSTEARKGGKPYTGRTAEQVRQRIADNVIITGRGCWEWQRGLTAQGYSNLQWLGITGGHRVSYAAYIRPIPPQYLVCHRCDNRVCVNPGHLFIGSYSDNNDDMTRKGRANRVGFATHERGERHPGAKLTDSDADIIRNSTGRGVDLAKEFGISQQAVCDIRKGRRRRI